MSLPVLLPAQMGLGLGCLASMLGLSLLASGKDGEGETGRLHFTLPVLPRGRQAHPHHPTQAQVRGRVPPWLLTLERRGSPGSWSLSVGAGGFLEPGRLPVVPSPQPAPQAGASPKLPSGLCALE